MPRIHEDSNPAVDPGFLIQLVSKDDVAKVRRLVETADEQGIERYVRHSENGMGILHLAATHQCQEMMICLVRRIRLCEQISMSQDFHQSIMRPVQYKVLALPSIRNYDNKTALQIAVQNDNTNIVRQLMPLVGDWNIDDNLIMHKDNHGHTVIQSASAKRLDTLMSIIEAVDKPRARTLLSHQGSYGWTSLHVSSITGNNQMVKTILSYFEGQEKQHFLAMLDDKGWTALDWAAAKGRIEVASTLLDHLGTDPFKENTRALSLVKACAYDNSAKSLSMLVKRFDNDKVLNLICDRPENAEEFLSLALEEGNLSVVLMSLEHADSRCHEALVAAANSVNMQWPVNSPIKRLLNIVTKTGKNLILHQAIIDNDIQLISLICNHNPKSRDELINVVRNEEGFSALHAACRHNNADAIRLMFDGMSSDDVQRSIKNTTPKRLNSLQLATKYRSVAALNAMLGRIPTKERKALLARPIVETDDSLHRLSARHSPTAHLIQSHLQFCNGLFEEIIDGSNDNFDVSNKTAVDNAYKHIEPILSSDPAFVCHANMGAAACIEKGDFEKARALIEAALAVDSRSIHTYVNIGRLHVKLQPYVRSTSSDLEQIAQMLLELKSNPEAQLLAKMECAYWLAEASRSEEDRFKCCQLMKECISEMKTIREGTDIENLCRTLYMKVLIRWVRSAESSLHRYDKENLGDKINMAIDQLIHLSESDSEGFYCREMLIWLAEIQKSKIEKLLQPYLCEGLERFRLQTNMSTDIEHCLNQAMGFSEKYPTDYKFKARLGFNCLEVAYRQSDLSERRKWLEQAISYCTKDLPGEDWIFMNSSTIAAASTNLWAISYYTRHKHEVDDLVREKLCRRATNDVSVEDALKFLSCKFYATQPDQNTDGRRILRNVYKHQTNIIKRHGHTTHGLQMTRIMCLLGEPKENILQVFAKCIHETADNRNLVSIYRCRGHYQILLGELDRATADLNEALNLVEDPKLIPVIKRALENIRYMQDPALRPAIGHQKWIRKSASVESESDRSDDWRADAEKFHADQKIKVSNHTPVRSPVNQQTSERWYPHPKWSRTTDTHDRMPHTRSHNGATYLQRQTNRHWNSHCPSRSNGSRYDAGIEGNWRDRSST